ncbi:MAG: hypothetical protein ACOYXT_29015 [Bacteroidota bacterium]
MNVHASHAHENRRLQTTATFSKTGSGVGSFQLIDNRTESIAQGKLQAVADNSPQVKRAVQLQALANSHLQQYTIQRKTDKTNVIQRQPKNIQPPTKEEVLVMDMLNQRNHELVKKYKMERKGTHGTNWMHAISIMKGIKAQIPKEMRTSEVTPEEGGFFVDTSKSGKAQSHGFAIMAAFGTPQVEGDENSIDDQMKYSKVNDRHREDFDAKVAEGNGTRRAIILEIWGQKNATPEARKKDQQDDEDVYRTNAHLLVATLKDSL